VLYIQIKNDDFNEDIKIPTNRRYFLNISDYVFSILEIIHCLFTGVYFHPSPKFTKPSLLLFCFVTPFYSQGFLSFFLFLQQYQRKTANIFLMSLPLCISACFLIGAEGLQPENCLLPAGSFLYAAVLKFGYVKRIVDQGSSLQISPGAK
jgi:hypothetical protein